MNDERVIEILERRSTIPDDDASWEEIMEAFDLAIKAVDLVTRLNGFKYCTTDVLLREHEMAHFDVYKQGWNDAIQAVINASERPLSEIVEAIKDAEVKGGGRE